MPTAWNTTRQRGDRARTPSSSRRRVTGAAPPATAPADEHEQRDERHDPADPPAQRPVGELDEVGARGDAHAAEDVVDALDLRSSPPMTAFQPGAQASVTTSTPAASARSRATWRSARCARSAPAPAGPGEPLGRARSTTALVARVEVAGGDRRVARRRRAAARPRRTPAAARRVARRPARRVRSCTSRRPSARQHRVGRGLHHAADAQQARQRSRSASTFGSESGMYAGSGPTCDGNSGESLRPPEPVEALLDRQVVAARLVELVVHRDRVLRDVADRDEARRRGARSCADRRASRLHRDVAVDRRVVAHAGAREVGRDQRRSARDRRAAPPRRNASISERRRPRPRPTQRAAPRDHPPDGRHRRRPARRANPHATAQRVAERVPRRAAAQHRVGDREGEQPRPRARSSRRRHARGARGRRGPSPPAARGTAGRASPAACCGRWRRAAGASRPRRPAARRAPPPCRPRRATPWRGARASDAASAAAGEHQRQRARVERARQQEELQRRLGRLPQ